MIGVKNGQFIQGGLKVRLEEMGVGDRRFSVDHGVISKERSNVYRLLDRQSENSGFVMFWTKFQ